MAALGRLAVETQTRGNKRLLCRHLGMLDYITTHPNGRTWAGAISDYLAAGVAASVDRSRWLKKLEQLRALTASRPLRPSQEILDELRVDRI